MPSKFNQLVKWLLNLNNVNMMLLATVSIIILVITFILVWKFIISIYHRFSKKTEDRSHLNQTRRTLSKDTKSYVLKISEKKMNKFKAICLKNGLTYSLCLDTFIDNYKGDRSNEKS